MKAKINRICKWKGHKLRFHYNEYGRFGNFHAIDGINRHHRNVLMRCERCDDWIEVCKIHTTELEGK